MGGMTWSYSRIVQFEKCKYGWFLNYIEESEKENLFFSDYGSFVHDIIRQFLCGELKKKDLYDYYLLNFRGFVKGIPPSTKIYTDYFQKGLSYFKDFSYPYSDIVSVENRVRFDVGGIPFVGFIDAVVRNGKDLVVVDNKSRDLSPRSNRKKPTKSDELLDEYLKQLYLYSIAVKNIYGEYPKRLEFNCFKSGIWISETFKESVLESVKQWAIDTIKEIEQNDKWTASPEFFKCKYLCDVRNDCEFFGML